MSFYQFFEQYIDEGYHPEQAEDMAWKMVQGETKCEDLEPAEENNKDAYCGPITCVDDYVDTPF